MSETNVTTPVKYRPVPGYPAYRVGDDGSVWSCWKRVGYRGDRRGTYRVLSDHWVPMKLHRTQFGYLGVSLQKKPFFVHRLVLMSFVGPCPKGQETRHLNDIKTDNRLNNLAWGTRQQNAEDKRRNCRLRFGGSHWNSILSDDLVMELRRRYADGETIAALADENKVSFSCIQHAVAGEGWQHLPGTVKKDRHVLTEKLVLEFRARAAAGENINQIAIQAGINKSTVRYAIRGRRWKHLPGAVPSRITRNRS